MKASVVGSVPSIATDRHRSVGYDNAKKAPVTSSSKAVRLTLLCLVLSVGSLMITASPAQTTVEKIAMPVVAGQDLTQVEWIDDNSGLPVPEVVFFDGNGNILGDGQLSAVGGVTMILEAGVDVPAAWTMQYRTRSRAGTDGQWTRWSAWELYIAEEPVDLETGRDHEIQVRYGIPTAVPQQSAADAGADSDTSPFALIQADQESQRIVLDGETVNFDVRVSLPGDRTYVSQSGEPLTSRLWILKASEGTVIRSLEDVLLEVLEGFIGRFTVVTQFLRSDGTVAAESEAVSFTIDRRPPPPVVLVSAEYFDRSGATLSDGAITNSDVSLSADIIPSDEELKVQYRMAKGAWMDMTMLDEDTVLARFKAISGETHIISDVELRYVDAAGNGSSARAYVAIPGTITMDREQPEPPALILMSQSVNVADGSTLNQPMRLSVSIPEGESGGIFQFSYDENGDGVYTAWKELAVGSTQDFTGAEESMTSYDIRVRFVDAAGNVSETRQQRVTIDLSKPAPPIWDLYDDKGIEMTDLRAVGIPVTLTARTRQSGSAARFFYRYAVSGRAGFTPWTPLEEGTSVRFEGERNASFTYELELRTMNAAGNVSETLKRTFTVDRQPPGTPLWNLRIVDSGAIVANGDIIGKAAILYPSKPSDNSPGIFEYQFIGGDQRVLTAWVPLSSGATRRFETADGTVSDFTVNIRYVDAVGNRSGITTRFFTIDRVGPEAPAWDLIRKEGGAPVDSADETNKGPVRLRATVPKDDPSARFEYRSRIDGGAWSDWLVIGAAGYVDFDGINQESVVYDISIRSVDTAGNPGAALTRSLVVDRDFPSPPTWDLRDSSGAQVDEGQLLNTSVTLYPVTPEYEFGGVFQFRSKSSLDAEYSVWQNLPEGSRYTFSGEIDDDIVYTIDIRYLDSAGNASTLLTRSLTIDRYPPAAPIWVIRDAAGAEVTNGLTVTSSVFLTAQPPSYESGGVYQYRFDDNSDGYFTAWQDLPIGDTVEFPGKPGERMRITLQIHYIDKAGNVGSDSELRFRIDRLAD